MNHIQREPREKRNLTSIHLHISVLKPVGIFSKNETQYKSVDYKIAKYFIMGQQVQSLFETLPI